VIAYLDHERSGASGFQDMGDQWVKVRNAAAHGTLRASDPEAREVAERWDQSVDYLCLGLGQDLGRNVRPMRPRKQTSDARLDAAAEGLAEAGTLQASFRVPDAVGPLTVQADLRTRQVSTSVVVEAPRDGRPQTRINWILRQLRQAPKDLRVDGRITEIAGPQEERLAAAARALFASRADSIEIRESEGARTLVIFTPGGILPADCWWRCGYG
jgi:hypothetical protein